MLLAKNSSDVYETRLQSLKTFEDFEEVAGSCGCSRPDCVAGASNLTALCVGEGVADPETALWLQKIIRRVF